MKYLALLISLIATPAWATSPCIWAATYAKCLTSSGLWIPSGGIKFPDNSIQTTAATAPAIGGALTGVTTGSVLYGSGGNFAQDNANFFWDGTNHRLGIGTTTPAAPLEVSDGTNYVRVEPSYVAGPRIELFSALGNTLIGASTAPALTIGTQNTVIGDHAGQTFDGDSNVVIGASSALAAAAGGSVTIGHSSRGAGNDVVIGDSAGNIASGGNNVIIGRASGTAAIGNSNINIGTSTTQIAAATSDAIAMGRASTVGSDQSMAIGLNATAGDSGDVVLGRNAVANGSNGIAIGSSANTSTFTHATAIGAGSAASASNTVNLGSSADGVVIPDTGGHNGNTPHACTTVTSSAGTATASCAANYIATGGGVDCGTTALFISQSVPTGGPPSTGWAGSCTSLLNVVTNTTIVVSVLCCAY